MTHTYHPQTKHVIDYVANEYGVEPEFLWPERTPECCIFRNGRNRKWFGIIMVIPGNKLGLNTNEKLDIIDLKFENGEALDFANDTPNIFPGWHMNKSNWITLILDGRMPDKAVFSLINNSFILTDKK